MCDAGKFCDDPSSRWAGCHQTEETTCWVSQICQHVICLIFPQFVGNQPTGKMGNRKIFQHHTFWGLKKKIYCGQSSGEIVQDYWCGWNLRFPLKLCHKSVLQWSNCTKSDLEWRRILDKTIQILEEKIAEFIYPSPRCHSEAANPVVMTPNLSHWQNIKQTLQDCCWTSFYLHRIS